MPAGGTARPSETVLAKAKTATMRSESRWGVWRMTAPLRKVVGFTRMDQGDAADYALLDALAKPYIAATGERVLAYLEGLSDGLLGYPIDRYQHSLQTATRALRAGECGEIVVAALLHDIGDALAPENHAELGAAVLRPYVARHTHWLVLRHGVFQGHYYFDKIGLDPNARERHRGHPAFDATERFCARYDQLSFDPHYDTLPIDAFEPLVARVFARKPWGAHTEADWPAGEA